MKYPQNLKNIIDVTKAPYYADHTGQRDCTAVLRRVFDDLLMREVEGIKETEARLHTLGENDVYIGFESRIEKNLVRVIFPEFVPDARIVYFPKGTYLVSDTITYTLKDLKNIFDSKPGFEMTRGIHIVGESRTDTVIKLKDNCDGFTDGLPKPIISLINTPDCLETAASNVSQMNSVADLTVDCGVGNPDAVGIRFLANNSGRMEHITVKGDGCDTGIQLAAGCEGVFRDISLSGFRVGVYAHKTSVCVLDQFCFEQTKEATVRAGYGSMTFVGFEKEDRDRVQLTGDHENYAFVSPITIPESDVTVTADDYALVEEYGAFGNGETDDTASIQRAFDSGKEMILFSGGHYLVNGNITVPKTVKRIDFMFCDFFAGENLITGKADALFTVNEDSDIPLIAEHLYTFEQFYGHFRLFCHAARRDLIFKDLHTQTAAMYYNIVPGSRVYLDDCACTVGTYSNDCIIGRIGFTPEFCGMIPYEFHGQSVAAFNLNPERADVEVLNDHSVLTVYGFKVEGPGTAIKTVNGGKTSVFVYSCGIGDITAKNALFENRDSELSLLNGKIFGVTDTLDYNLILDSQIAEKRTTVYKRELEPITKYRVNFSWVSGETE